MSRTYTDDHGSERLPPGDDARRVERRRWFEHTVMVPVGFGMIATFIAKGGTGLAAALGAPAWINDKPWVAIAFVAATCAVFVCVRVLRR